MSDLRDAARQALEALKCLVEAYEMDNTIRADIVDAEEAITALRAALEQPEQAEPVAWWIVSKTTDEEFVSVRPNDWSDINWEKHPLYTHPPRREWRSLSEEEIAKCWHDTPWNADLKTRVFAFFHTVEAALRSKNHE
jgi:hypothetical protein